MVWGKEVDCFASRERTKSLGRNPMHGMILARVCSEGMRRGAELEVFLRLNFCLAC